MTQTKQNMEVAMEAVNKKQQDYEHEREAWEKEVSSCCTIHAEQRGLMQQYFIQSHYTGKTSVDKGSRTLGSRVGSSAPA